SITSTTSLGSTSARPGQRLEQRRGFVARLQEFFRRHRVRNDAGRSLNRGETFFDHHGSNRDAGVEVTGEAQVTDPSRIDTASLPFELGDDLHGADLRSPGHGTRWEAGAKGIHWGTVRAQPPGDVGNQVHDV